MHKGDGGRALGERHRFRCPPGPRGDVGVAHHHVAVERVELQGTLRLGHGLGVVALQRREAGHEPVRLGRAIVAADDVADHG